MSAHEFMIDPTLSNPKAICTVAPNGAVTFDWQEIEKAGARGHQYALAFLAAREAGRVEARVCIPTLDSRTVNDACWAMIGALPERVTGPNWNEFKPAFYQALQLVHREHYAKGKEARPQVPDGMVPVIEVEKLLCGLLGREWSAAGMSIASLAEELAKRRDEVWLVNGDCVLAACDSEHAAQRCIASMPAALGGGFRYQRMSVVYALDGGGVVVRS